MQSKPVASGPLPRAPSPHGTAGGRIPRPKLRSKLVDVVVEGCGDGVDRGRDGECVRTSVFVQRRKDTDERNVRSSLNTLAIGLSYLRLNDDSHPGVDVSGQTVETQIRQLCRTPHTSSETALRALHAALLLLTARTTLMNGRDVRDARAAGGADGAGGGSGGGGWVDLNAVRLARTAVAALESVRLFSKLVSEDSGGSEMSVGKSVGTRVVLAFDCIETSIARLTKAWYDNGRPDQGLAASARQTNIAIHTARAKILNASTISPLDIDRAQVENDRAKTDARKNDKNNATVARCAKGGVGRLGDGGKKRGVQATVESVGRDTARRAERRGDGMGRTQSASVWHGPKAQVKQKRPQVRFSAKVVSASHAATTAYAVLRAVFEDRGLGRADEATLEGIGERASCLTFGSFHALYGMIRAVVVRVEREAGVREMRALRCGRAGTKEEKCDIMRANSMAMANASASQVVLAYSDRAVFSWLLRGMPPANKHLKRRLDATDAGGRAECVNKRGAMVVEERR